MGGRSVRCAALVSVVMCLSLVLVGCTDDSASVWSGEARSPSGRWVSTATTTQTGGPGTASVGTAVYLRWTASSRPPTLILGLENETAYPIGITAIKMTWLTENQLELAYCEGKIGFQSVKAGGDVDITVRQLNQADCPRPG